MDITPYLPLVTAALTLANTVFLFFMNNRQRAIHKHVNGMQLQLLSEAERRGRRHASHARDRLGDPPRASGAIGPIDVRHEIPD